MNEIEFSNLEHKTEKLIKAWDVLNTEYQNLQKAHAALKEELTLQNRKSIAVTTIVQTVLARLKLLETRL